MLQSSSQSNRLNHPQLQTKIIHSWYQNRLKSATTLQTKIIHSWYQNRLKSSTTLQAKIIHSWYQNRLISSTTLQTKITNKNHLALSQTENHPPTIQQTKSSTCHSQSNRFYNHESIQIQETRINHPQSSHHSTVNRRLTQTEVQSDTFSIVGEINCQQAATDTSSLTGSH